MNEWKEIPEEARDQAARKVAALEAVFRPLAAALTEDVEPAVTFRAEEDEE